MNKPLFSIIVPTYNRANQIDRTIQSVQAQTFSDWELIIIDDGSTDNTKDVVANYTSTDSRICYYFQENQERSAARNNGIEKAKGEYICFLDSDDVYFDFHLMNFNSFLIANEFPTAAIFSKKINDPSVENLRTSEVILKAVFHCQHACIHHSIFKEFKFDKHINIAEDLELWLRIATKFDLFFISKDTVQIIDHDDRTVSLMNNNHYLSTYNVLKNSFKNEPIRNHIRKAYRKESLSNCLIGSAKYYFIHGKYLLALRYIFRSIIKAPKSKFNYKLVTFKNILFVFCGIKSKSALEW